MARTVDRSLLLFLCLFVLTGCKKLKDLQQELAKNGNGSTTQTSSADPFAPPPPQPDVRPPDFTFSVDPTARDAGTSYAAPAASLDPFGLGKPAPDFNVAAVGRGKASLHALKGKVVVVYFWATWCAPCEKAFPTLRDLYAKYKSNGLEIVALAEDDDGGGIKAYGDRLGAKFTLAWDQGQDIAHRYELAATPSTYVLDKKGNVRFVHVGYASNEAPVIASEVKSLL